MTLNSMGKIKMYFDVNTFKKRQDLSLNEKAAMVHCLALIRAEQLIDWLMTEQTEWLSFDTSAPVSMCAC